MNILRHGLWFTAFLTLLFFMNSRAAWAIRVEDSESQKKRKGRYYNPTKLDWPKFEQPKFEQVNFDPTDEEGDTKSRRTPDKKSNGEGEMSDADLAKTPGYEELERMMNPLQKDSSSQRPEQVSGDEQEGIFERLKETLKETLKVQGEVEKKNASSSAAVKQAE